MQYFNPNEKLHGCWWCGKPVSLELQRANANHHYPRCDYDIYRVYCRNVTDHVRCNVHSNSFYTKHTDQFGKEYGVDGAREAAIEAWNAGEVAIPLRVTLPMNHFVFEKTILEPKVSYYRSYRLNIFVPKDRDIAATFKKKLSIALNYDGTPTNHTFTLFDSMAVYLASKLISVEENPGTNSGMVSFVFESENCSFLDRENKCDTAWLKSETVRPPIWDHIFNIMAKD